MATVKSQANILLACSFIGLSFLWPYYQRAFYRVTLFHSLGANAEMAYGVFLGLVLMGCVVAAVRYRTIENLLHREPMIFLAAALLSLVTGAYLTGMVVPAPSAAPVFSLLAVGGYGMAFLVISAGAALVLMRLAYTVGIFQGAAVLSASAMMGKVISPTSAAADSPFGLIPVIGLFVAGIAVVLPFRMPSGEETSVSYDEMTKAPYGRAWLLPLGAYCILSISHAFRYAFDMTNEVSSVSGEIVPAAVSYFPALSFFVFAGLLLTASLHSARSDVPSWNRSAFWVAALGVAVGLLVAPALMALAGVDGGLAQFDAGTGPVSLLLAVCILLFTYQNRLSPLQTFGVFLCGAMVVEKIIAYIVCPPLFAAFAPAAAQGAYVAIALSQFATLGMLLLFLARLCQGNVLALLFPANVPAAADDESDRRRIVCTAIGEKADLSDREVDVLYYLSGGYSARRTGEALFISERTVQTHTQNIYRKLNVHNRQAVIDLVESEGGD